MENNLRVITNNPLVRDKFAEFAEKGRKKIDFCDTDYLGVLKAARDKIHTGHRLLTHPLSGSVKPGETPYKTVLLSGGANAGEKKALDEESLALIESAIQTCLKFTENRQEKKWSEKIRADFQLIDYSLIFG